MQLELSGPITVLIGPNNVGKSNIIESLLLLRDAIKATFNSVVQSRNGFARIASGQNSGVLVHLELVLSEPGSADIQYLVDFDSNGILVERATGGDGFAYSAIRAGRFWDVNIAPNLGTNRFQQDAAPLIAWRPVQSPQLIRLVEHLNQIVHVDPFRSINANAAVGPAPVIDSKGSNLAQVLHYHYNNDRDKFDAYEVAVQKVLPEVDIIETPLIGGPTTTVRLRFKYDQTKYDLSEISSGIKGVLVMLAAAHFSPPGTLLLIEEPETHIHPAAQKALCSVIKELAAADDKQFILSTHSDSILGQFAPEDCFFVDRSVSGSRVARLAEVDAYQIWERLGIDRSLLLEVLGRPKQVVVITEGRDDTKVLEALWRDSDLSDSVLPARANGGGWREIVDSAASLREAFNRFRISSEVFVLLDGDAESTQKIEYLADKGFGADLSHVWSEKELESFLLMPHTLASLSGRSVDDVLQVLGNAQGAGKGRLHWVLQQLGISGTPNSVIVTNAARQHQNELPEEFKSVTVKVRALLGLRPGH